MSSAEEALVEEVEEDETSESKYTLPDIEQIAVIASAAVFSKRKPKTWPVPTDFKDIPSLYQIQALPWLQGIASCGGLALGMVLVGKEGAGFDGVLSRVA